MEYDSSALIDNRSREISDGSRLITVNTRDDEGRDIIGSRIQMKRCVYIK